MKLLKVPYLQQDESSDDCGPTCVQMVLGYFGIERNAKELTKSLEHFEMGTSAYDNGRLLLDADLKVEAITRQPLLFSPDTVSAFRSVTDLDAICQNEKKKKRLEKFASGIDKMRIFLAKGGVMKLEIPSFKHIREAIDADRPVIALTYARALGDKEGGFHFVVVNGYDEGKVHILNPLPSSSHEGWFPVDDFLYAVHSSTTTDIDNGTLLAVGK